MALREGEGAGKQTIPALVKVGGQPRNLGSQSRTGGQKQRKEAEEGTRDQSVPHTAYQTATASTSTAVPKRNSYQ